MAANDPYYMHATDALKGWSLATNLDIVAPLSPNVTLSPVYGGTTVHVNPVGAFELGAVDAQMPVFLIQGSNAFDVSNQAPAGSFWSPMFPAGAMSGLVATGGYELSTTEFVASGTYACGDKLHAPTEAEITGTDKSRAGLLHNTKSWPGGTGGLVVTKDNICGIVSRVVAADMNGINRLSFWPTYTPGNSTSTFT
jgi:hypothetical protein